MSMYVYVCKFFKTKQKRNETKKKKKKKTYYVPMGAFFLIPALR